METILHDLRVGVRLLWKDKAFTLTAALTLALCIGANTALFSVVHNVLLRPLPVPDSGRIVLMGNAYPGAGASAAAGGNSGVPDYYDRLRDTDVYEEQALFNGTNQSMDQGGIPVRIRVTRATPSFFRLLRVAPLLGRTFTEDEGEVGNDKKVVLSYSLVAVAIRRRSRRDRQGPPHRRRPVHGRRRDAERFLLPESDGDALAAAGLHAGSRRATISGTTTATRTSRA